jgi:pilus assembly protein CpaE
MNESLNQTFLGITRTEEDLQWLQSALAPQGQVIGASSGSLDELLALINATFSTLVFIGLDREQLVNQCALIEGVLEAKPMLAIVALGDGMDNQLVLHAMRAGARDFVAYGSRASEVAGLVRRLGKRMPTVTNNPSLGGLTVLYGVQSGADGALLTTHLARVVQDSGQQTLLLDLGMPRGDSLALLGLEASFYFGDALRHLRRLDTTLIDSAFTRDNKGLRLLTYAVSDEPLHLTSPAELYMLLSALRQHFQHIIVNLTGHADSEALRTIVSHCDKLIVYTDQNILDCRRNLDVLELWRDQGIKLEHAGLLVDRYLANVAPDAESLAKRYALPLLKVMPDSPMVRLNVKNQGLSLFEMAPRESLTLALRSLGERLAQRSENLSPPALTWLRRLWGNK